MKLTKLTGKLLGLVIGLHASALALELERTEAKLKAKLQSVDNHKLYIDECVARHAIVVSEYKVALKEYNALERATFKEEQALPSTY